MALIITAILYLLFFGAVELITKKFSINKEFSRKFAHIAVGISVAFLPALLSFQQIAILSIVFMPTMLFSKRISLFSSIHNVSRSTYGEVYFPASILITAILFPNKIIFGYGILVMALADALAGILGQRYGNKKYSILGSNKSYLGSSVFFIVCFILSLWATTQLGFSSIEILVVSIFISLISTFTEAILTKGLDNLLIPPLASFLLWVATKIYL